MYDEPIITMMDPKAKFIKSRRTTAVLIEKIIYFNGNPRQRNMF